MQLPDSFLNHMKEILGDEYQAFQESLKDTGFRGLRVNTSKITAEEFEKISPFPLKQVPWIPNGFYSAEADKASKHPYYAAGLYYLQEPSAMTPAAFLPVEPGDRVLDLCAAPGGKATELAARLQGHGLLAANDISSSRAKGLLKNLELFGAGNILVCSEDPKRLAASFESFFDKILIDAPCSGEGMFRREPSMAKDWMEHGPAWYAAIQRELLKEASRLLRPGGLLLYSTCTFSPEENEGSILSLLNCSPDFHLLPLPHYDGFACGRPDLLEAEMTSEQEAELKHCVRIYPHRLKGEGHFVALLKKDGEEARPKPHLSTGNLGAASFSCPQWEAFASNIRRSIPKESLRLYDRRLYSLPEALFDVPIRGLRILRTGLYLGDVEKSRFTPSQALALSLKKEEYACCLDLPLEDERVVRYLKGETLDVSDLGTEDMSGWQLVCVDGFSLGWAKLAGGSFRNKYYAGWRWQHAAG